MPVEDRARTLDELRGLVDRLGGVTSISRNDVDYLARLVDSLGYQRKAGLALVYHTEGQYGNVVALGRNILNEEVRRAAETEPKKLFKDD